MRVVLLASALLIAAPGLVQAKDYNVAYLGEKALKATCERGKGTAHSGTNSYGCTYQNGNIRECNRKSKKCIMVTPT